MFYSARSQVVVDSFIGLFRQNAKAETIALALSALSRDEIESSIEYAHANGVLPLFVAQLKSMDCLAYLPSDIREMLVQILMEGQQEAGVQLREALEVVQALQEAGISCLVLKGIVFARLLYAHVGPRLSRDLDLLIEPQKMSKARIVLKQLGFAESSNAKIPAHHLPRMVRSRLNGTQLSIEAHHRLVPPLIYGIRIREFDDLWEHSIWVDIDEEHKIRTLSKVDHVLHMHIHLFHHLFYNFRMLHLMDIVFAARYWQSQVNWTDIADRLHQIGLERFRFDLWSWIAFYFGDVLSAVDSTFLVEAPDIGYWLLLHGSLPMFAGLRYSKGSQEFTYSLINECRRFLYRSLWAPEWGLLHSRRR